MIEVQFTSGRTIEIEDTWGTLEGLMRELSQGPVVAAAGPQGTDAVIFPKHVEMIMWAED